MSFKKGNVYPPLPNTTRGASTKLSTSKDKILYANGKSIVIRDLNVSPNCFPGSAPSIVYTGHTQITTVARISPSGYYCASGDALGTVRIWDTVGGDQTLKAEYKTISGRINDLAWDGESKRIVAVGDGRGKFGHAFMMDTGASTGEISGHSQVINAVSIRHQRPFRAATASDDGNIIFHQGVPFKYDKIITTHTKFVQDVQYGSSGNHFASVGTDFKVFVYDGKTGDTVGEMDAKDGHQGSVMACSWSPDEKELMTVSADRTVKIWDVETRKSKQSYTLGDGILHQQVGGVWTGDGAMVSLSLSGTLNVFDSRVGGTPRSIFGPQKAVTTTCRDLGKSKTLFAGTADGRVLTYDDSGAATLVTGNGHSNFVSGIAVSAAQENPVALSVGFDDHVREIAVDGTAGAFGPNFSATAEQPKAIAIGGDGTAFIAEASRIEAFRSNQLVSELRTTFTATSISAHGTVVTVGGDDMKVRVYDWDGKALKETGVLERNKGVVSALAISPDGMMLAAGDSSGKVMLFDLKTREVVTPRWAFHSARVNGLSWTADSKYCASGSLDTHVYVWSVANPVKNIAIKNAGMGGVNTVCWLDERAGGATLASAGADASLRIWDVTFHA